MQGFLSGTVTESEFMGQREIERGLQFAEREGISANRLPPVQGQVHRDKHEILTRHGRIRVLLGRQGSLSALFSRGH